MGELAGNTVAEKLAANVVRDGMCLRWMGAHTPKGYGQLRVDGRAQRRYRQRRGVTCG